MTGSPLQRVGDPANTGLRTGSEQTEFGNLDVVLHLRGHAWPKASLPSVENKRTYAAKHGYDFIARGAEFAQEESETVGWSG